MSKNSGDSLVSERLELYTYEINLSYFENGRFSSIASQKMKSSKYYEFWHRTVVYSMRYFLKRWLKKLPGKKGRQDDEYELLEGERRWGDVWENLRA